MPLADLAGYEYVRQEVHFYLDDSVAFARLAAAALDVERESPRSVALRLRFVCLGEQVADIVEHAGVGRGIAPRGAPYRRLVYHYHLVEVFGAGHIGEPARAGACSVQLCNEVLVDYLVDKRAFAASGNSGNAGEYTERHVYVDIAEVVFSSSDNVQPLIRRLTALFRHRYLQLSGKVLSGYGILAFQQPADFAAVDDLAAVDSRAGADVDYPVGGAHGVLVVLDYYQRVSEVAQTSQRCYQLIVVALVKSDGRLVQDIKHAGKGASYLRCKAYALALAAGEGPC